MKLQWTRRALRQLAEAQDYIAKDNPLAAKRIAERITQAAHLLLLQPEIGHPGRIAGTREWVISSSRLLWPKGLDKVSGARATGLCRQYEDKGKAWIAAKDREVAHQRDRYNGQGPGAVKSARTRQNLTERSSWKCHLPRRRPIDHV